VEEDVIVCGSERQLLTVFENVISNAVKYTPEGGIISVVHRTDLEGGFFSVWVKDSGPGMRSSDALTFGQPFVTGNAVPTGGESSTGLGLFLATKEVAALGGTIHVEDGETGGTVFSITIPLCRINER
jgi:signal transduction histidine kinase